MRKPCNQHKLTKPQEKIVIPLFEIVVYPESRTKFRVEQATGELLLARMNEYRGCICRRAYREERNETFGGDRRVVVQHR